MLCWLRGSFELCHTLGVFCFLRVFGEDCTMGLNLMPFFPASCRHAAFFLSFESRRQPDVEFLFQSCLQPVCCLYQLLTPRLLAGLFRAEKSSVVEV